MGFRTIYVGKETKPSEATKWVADKAIRLGSHLVLWGVEKRGYLKPREDIIDDEELKGDLGLLGEWPDIF